MKNKSRDNPGSPGVKILCFQLFDPWLHQENWDPICCAMRPTKQNKNNP